VLAKPQGWVADARAPEDEDDGAGGAGTQPGRSLVAFLGAHCGGWSPIVRDRDHRHGVLHRLDANSSGLILGALSFSRYYQLHALLDAQMIEREYVALLHGRVAENLTLINARVAQSQTPGGRSSVRPEGKPAVTHLKVVAHLERSGEAASEAEQADREFYTLAVLHILTGRTHQIRTHMAHVGHPVVCDAKYSSGATFARDVRWCSRNFLHRYRLGFHGSEALQPLPEDLTKTLAGLAPVCDASRSAVAAWLPASVGHPAAPLPPYRAWERLPGKAGAVAEEVAGPTQAVPAGSGETDDGLVWRLTQL